MVPYRRGDECSSRWPPRRRGLGERGRPPARRSGSGRRSIGRWIRRRARCAPRPAPSTGSPASSCTPLHEQADGEYLNFSSDPSTSEQLNKATMKFGESWGGWSRVPTEGASQLLDGDGLGAAGDEPSLGGGRRRRDGG